MQWQEALLINFTLYTRRSGPNDSACRFMQNRQISAEDRQMSPCVYFIFNQREFSVGQGEMVMRKEAFNTISNHDDGQSPCHLPSPHEGLG